MNRVYIGVGSNVGDRLRYLQHAVQLLRESADIHVRRVSSVYETEPVGVTDQGWFLNAVLDIETQLSPDILLERTQSIERALHKHITRRWGPRTIDLDILLYGNRQLKTTTLEIPHPRLRQRAFVLVPLLELDPTFSLPDGTALSACIPPLVGREQVRLWASPAVLA